MKSFSRGAARNSSIPCDPSWRVSLFAPAAFPAQGIVCPSVYRLFISEFADG